MLILTARCLPASLSLIYGVWEAVGFFSQMHPAQRSLHDTKLINVGQAECN